jgi:hypothetical protein
MKSRAPRRIASTATSTLPPRRHHDDRERGIEALDAREQVEPFLAGRRVARVVQVDQRDVELTRFDGGQHAGGRRRRFELEALGLQQQPQRLEDVGLIVGDQHARLGGPRGTRVVGGVAILQVVGDQHRCGCLPLCGICSDSVPLAGARGSEVVIRGSNPALSPEPESRAPSPAFAQMRYGGQAELSARS